MKVLFLVSNLRASNGVSSFAINYFRHLNHTEIQLDFALYADRPSPYYKELESCGSQIFFLPSIKNIKQQLQVCNHILTEGQYDIVHDNTLHISLPMMWCAQRHHVPVRILHSHSAKLGETKIKAYRNHLFLPILRSLVTDYAACSILAGKGMFGEETYTYIPNVVNVQKYSFNSRKRIEIREKMGVNSKRIIGTVGRIANQKNPFFALQVIKALLAQMPNVEYWWIGSGDLDDKVKKYAKSLGIAKHVKFWGSRNDVIHLYQAIDCFFLPSLFEGLPVTGIEAQAMGLPMVVSDSVTKEMVYTDLVDYVDLHQPVEVWADHLQRALQRTIHREKYANDLRNSVFSDELCGENLMNIYIKLLNKNS